MIDYYLYCFKNYANFEGRARRSEYWYFVLCNVLVIIILAMLSGLSKSGYGFIFVIAYIFGMLLPWIAVTVRRLHDSGKSGGYFFVRFIPLIGGIWSLVLMCTDSEYGKNIYGYNPKGDGNEGNAANETLINSIGNELQNEQNKVD
jgi:uncharacterized membrane protein YhaH (DUF805 family)